MLRAALIRQERGGLNASWRRDLMFALSGRASVAATTPVRGRTVPHRTPGQARTLRRCSPPWALGHRAVPAGADDSLRQEGREVFPLLQILLRRCSVAPSNGPEHGQLYRVSLRLTRQKKALILKGRKGGYRASPLREGGREIRGSGEPLAPPRRARLPAGRSPLRCDVKIFGFLKVFFTLCLKRTCGVSVAPKRPLRGRYVNKFSLNSEWQRTSVVGGRNVQPGTSFTP